MSRDKSWQIAKGQQRRLHQAHSCSTLQDAKRITVYGERTSGGGNVVSLSGNTGPPNLNPFAISLFANYVGNIQEVPTLFLQASPVVKRS